MVVFALFAPARLLRGCCLGRPVLLGGSAVLALPSPRLDLRTVGARGPVAALAARPSITALFMALLAAPIPAEALVRATFRPPAETIAFAPIALGAL
jgi:hypothetical protein